MMSILLFCHGQCEIDSGILVDDKAKEEEG